MILRYVDFVHVAWTQNRDSPGRFSFLYHFSFHVLTV